MDHRNVQVVKNPTLALERTLERLRHIIGRGCYPPGMRLVERELCEALGVSSASMRKALHQLQAENLIELGNRGSVTIAVINAKDAEDIYVVREMVETLAVRRFVAQADRDASENLARIHSDLRTRVEKDDVRGLAISAGEWYQAIVTGSGSRTIAEMSQHLVIHANYLRMRSMAEPQRREAVMQEWDRVKDAIFAGNADAAAQAMSEHLTLEGRAIVSRLRQEEQSSAARDH